MRRPNSRGFTLIEMMVVIALIGGIAVLTLPSLHRMRKGDLRGQILSLETFFRRVQGEALSTKGLFRVRYDEDEDFLIAEIYEGTDFEPATLADGRPNRFPFGGRRRLLLEEASREGRTLDGDWTVLHFPDGRRERVTLVVADADGRRRQLEVPSLFRELEVTPLERED